MFLVVSLVLLLKIFCLVSSEKFSVEDYIVDCAGCYNAPVGHMESYTCTVRCQHTEPVMNLTGMYGIFEEKINEERKKSEQLNSTLVKMNEVLNNVLSQLNETKEKLDLHNKQVAFSVKLQGQPTMTNGDTFMYSKVVSNIGGAYDPSTGIFTAPYDGLYQFKVTAMALSLDGYAQLVVAGSNVCNAYGNSDQDTGTCNAVVSIHQGDTVHVECITYNGASREYNAGYNSFTGVLLKIEA